MMMHLILQQCRVTWSSSLSILSLGLYLGLYTMILADMIAALHKWTRLFREPGEEAQPANIQKEQHWTALQHSHLHVEESSPPHSQPVDKTSKKPLKTKMSTSTQRIVDGHVEVRKIPSTGLRWPSAFGKQVIASQGMYGICPLLFGYTGAIFGRNIYNWSMGRLKNLDSGNCAMHGLVCLWLLHDSHQSITFASSVCWLASKAAKRHEHLQVSHTKKATNKWRTFIAQNLTIHNGTLAQRNTSRSHTLLVFGLYQAGPQTKQNLRHWYISIYIYIYDII